MKNNELILFLEKDTSFHVKNGYQLIKMIKRYLMKFLYRNLNNIRYQM
jgi:hypothetical protein